MKSVFIIKDRAEDLFMVVISDQSGSTFKPMTENAKELSSYLADEYSKTSISKTELTQSIDASMTVEGPSPYNSLTRQKISMLSQKSDSSSEIVPVTSVSEVALSEFSHDEFMNVVSYKAASFIADRTKTTFGYEVKRVRAMWDPSLSIPGTNRRGGWRCPVGTRYGGQITDRFGRQCGWGVARRIANAVSNIGERLENIDDRKRNRRLERRNARMVRHLQGRGGGRVERGLRGVADVLDGGSTPSVRPQGRAVKPSTPDIIDAVEPRVPRQRRNKPRRRPQPSQVEPPQIEPQRPVRPARPVRPVRPARPVDGERLTIEEASDAQLSEPFSKYVTRKYGEYARNVRLLNEQGKPAGMMTRRQWYAVNKPNLRDAWKDAHGRSAPQNFEPAPPRRPRNNRANRRNASVQQAQRTATRRPEPDSVPEPAPARPVRPARRRRSPDGRGFVTPGDGRSPARPARENIKMPDFGGAGWDAIKQPDGSTKWKKGNWIIELLPEENGNFRGLKASNTVQGVIMEREYQGPQGQGSLNSFLRRFEDIGEIDSAVDVSPQSAPTPTPTPARPAPASIETPTTPIVPPRPVPARAPRASQKSPIRPYNREGNPHGVLPIERGNGGLGKWVDKEDRRIDTTEKAIEHIKNGGDLQKVPSQFMFEAIFQNSSSDDTDLNKRFRRVTPNGGAIGFTQLFFLRGEDGKKTHQGWVMKASRDGDNLGELIGWNFLAEVGMIGDGAIVDGRVDASPALMGALGRYGARAQALSGAQFVVTPMAFNDVPNDHEIGPDGGPNRDYVLAQLQRAPDRGVSARLAGFMTNYILGVSDRHAGNGIGRIVTSPDGTKKAIVVPIDLGWTGQNHGGTVAGFGQGFRMDPELMIGRNGQPPNLQLELQLIRNLDKRRQAYREMIQTFDDVISKAEKVLSVTKDSFVEDALKNQARTADNVRRAEGIYGGMQSHLTKLKATRNKVVAYLPVDER